MILHATWCPEKRRHLLWAEEPAPRPGRRAAASRAPRRHPGAASIAALTAEVHLPGPGTEITLLLPAGDGRPLPSVAPGLPTVGAGENREGEAPEHVAELSLWKVPALAIEPTAALDWLGTGVPGEGEGPDLRFWRAAARFALGLLRRERWLPGLRRTEGGFAAAWLPILNQPEDAFHFRRLGDAMPPACRALRSAASERAPGRHELLRSFLETCVDAAVREWAAGAATQPRGTAAATWLSALTSKDGRIAERAENVRPLEAALRTWLEPVRAAGEAGFRTCFRLDPPAPEEDDAPWLLSFWLQAVDEPSLLVPAAAVWAHGPGELSALGRRWEAPQERLLPALARAARLFPPIEKALKSKAPAGCALDTPEAYQFLREVAPLLEETGNGVLVPDWWRKPAARLGVRVRMKGSTPSVASGLLSQDRLVQFDWQLALGDEPLSPEEFAQLASLKTPLVRLRGRWLEVRPDEIERTIEAWERRKKAGELGLLDALRLGEEEDGLPVTGVEAEGQLKELLGRLQGDGALQPVPVPESFRGVLRPYQQYGLEWLAFHRRWRLGACLADDMGLGKTIQVLAYILHARQGVEGLAPALLVCPTSLVENWRREAARFAPTLRVYVHHGAGRVRGPAGAEGAAPPFAEAVAGHDLVVTTYPLALRDQAALEAVNWDAVILDEAQNVKNPEAGQSRAVRALPAATKIAMTGTPVENRLTDLWSIMQFLNPGFLGSQQGFRRKYANPIEREQDPDASERLRRLTRPFVLRRVKTDPSVIQDLPEKQEMKVACTLTSEQATLYEAVVREMMEQVEEAEGIQRRGLVLAILSRLKQVCNHPAHFLHDGSALAGRSGKVERLVEMLEEALSVGDAALVFTQFAEMGELLQAHLTDRLGKEALFLHGGVPRKQRDRLVDRFQSPGGPPVMVLSLKAGGLGLNLVRASHVFHFDRWWNPAVENQATDRAFRIGQTKRVQVHKFLCAGTLEDHIDAMIEQKQALAESIVGAGEDWLTELSTSQLRELVSLRREAG